MRQPSAALKAKRRSQGRQPSAALKAKRRSQGRRRRAVQATEDHACNVGCPPSVVELLKKSKQLEFRDKYLTAVCPRHAESPRPPSFPLTVAAGYDA